MSYLLNLLYLAAFLVASPWMVYRSIRTGRYREGWLEKLFGLTPIRKHPERPSLWLHAVSVGEVQLLLQFVTAMAERLPNHEIVISTTTQTGMQLARKLFPERTLFYCPMDFTWAVQNCLQRIKPTMLILAELELWPNLIAGAKKSGCKICIINGRLSERSFRGYGRIKFLVASTLRKFDLIAVQDEAYAERFRKLGAPQGIVHVTGSMKFDGAEVDRSRPEIEGLRTAFGFRVGQRIWVAGSTQAPEEQFVIAAYRTLLTHFPELRLVLVPRHPERGDEVARLLDGANLSYIRRSCGNRTINPNDAIRVILVDIVGELRWWWGTADLAFVGGSFGDRGGQNMIEPAAFGVSTCFGPNTRNFKDIVALLLEADAARQLNQSGDLEIWAKQMLSHPDLAAELGRRGREIALAHRGATERTVALILESVDTRRATLDKAFLAA